MALPTAIQMISQYLWGSFAIPNPASLADDKWIRPTGETSKIDVDVLEYMISGGGRFATADKFGIFRKFFDGVGALEPKEDGYTLLEAAIAIYGREHPVIAKIEAKEFYTDLYQSRLGTSDADYADRSYVFNSTKFTVDEKHLKFIVKADGSREIKDLLIVPKENDDFNYLSTEGLAGVESNKWGQTRLI